MPLIEFICPECGYTTEELTSVDEKAPICKNCGAQYSDTEERCPYCGASLEPQFVFCPKCGRRL